MAKWLSEEALQIAEEIKEAKSKGERERYIQLNTEFQRIARREKRAFFFCMAWRAIPSPLSKIHRKLGSL